MKKLDKVDKKIIQILQKNARTPLKEICHHHRCLQELKNLNTRV